MSNISPKTLPDLVIKSKNQEIPEKIALEQILIKHYNSHYGKTDSFYAYVQGVPLILRLG
jgi:hypothetical protein